MDATEALTRLGGIADTSAVLALSSRRRLRTAVEHGRVVRVSRRRCALPTADVAEHAALALDGYATHLSAAAHWQWEIASPPELPQVAVRRRRRLPARLPVPAEVFRLDLQAEDVDGWALNRLQTAVVCARDLAFPDALAVADSALRHGDLTPEQLARATSALAGPGADRARRVAAYADARAANPFESVLRALAIEAGLDVIPQYATRCGDLLLHPDLADPFRGIVLEADSWTWHGDPVALDRDCARYNALVLAGWTVLRFSWPQVMHSPTYVRNVLAGVLRAAS